MFLESGIRVGVPEKREVGAPGIGWLNTGNIGSKAGAHGMERGAGVSGTREDGMQEIQEIRGNKDVAPNMEAIENSLHLIGIAGLHLVTSEVSDVKGE